MWYTKNVKKCKEGKIAMGHKIAEAIMENGQIRRINKKLPRNRMKVHLIYDDVTENLSRTEIARIVGETSGIYSGVNVEAESMKLRKTWERNAHN